MATDKTLRLIGAAEATRLLNAGIRRRRQLQEEGILLTRGIAKSQERIVEINEEEELISVVIDENGAIVEAASKGPLVEPVPP